MAFPAKYRGYCQPGEHPIEEGELIVDSTQGYAHEECVGIERSPRPVCPECFTEITPSGVCSC